MLHRRADASGAAAPLQSLTPPFRHIMQDDTSARHDLPDANVRASSYYVLQARHLCKHCQQTTPVFALAVPPNHESTEADIDLDEDASRLGLAPGDFHDWLFSPEQWQTIPGPALLTQIGSVSAPVALTLQRLASALRPDAAQGAQWTNFCEHCGNAVWEGALYPTPGQPFCPEDDATAAQITVHTIDAPFDGYARMIWTDRYRNKWPLFKRLGLACSEAD